MHRLAFWRTHRWLLLFLVVLLAVGTFLRFYNLRDSLMFQGDQGRDALVVSEVFKHLDPVFIGPVTSIGNMYLGPFYYYFMLPFLWLTYPDPMGPVYAVAALSVLSIGLLFYVALRLFSKPVAITASIFFTLSAAAVTLSRFSWNPNLAPFFSIIMLYGSYIAWHRNPRYWLLVALAFSLLTQLHYVTLLAGAAAGLIFLWQLFRQAKQRRQLLINGALSMLIFILSFTPLVLFDIKHGGLNAHNFLSIMTEKESFDLQRKQDRRGVATVYKFFNTDLKEKSSQVLFETSFGVHPLNHPLLLVTLLGTTAYLWRRRGKLPTAEWMLLTYLGVGIVGISLYQHDIYEHYIAYLFPLVFLYYALLLSKIRPRFLQLFLTSAMITYFAINNAGRWPLQSHDWTIDDMRRTAIEIERRVATGEKYNIVLLAPSKDLYGMNYRYFLHTLDQTPVALEDHHLADKLFVINEEGVEIDVLALDIYEIVVFADKYISDEFQVEGGPQITVLSKADKAL